MSRSRLDQLTDTAKELGAKGSRVQGHRRGPRLAAGSVPERRRGGGDQQRRRGAGRRHHLVRGRRYVASCRVLGALRVILGSRPVGEDPPLRVGHRVPMFEGVDETATFKRAPPLHHAHPDDLDLLASEPSRSAARPTTSCSTAGNWAAARCESTAPTSSRGSSARSASATRRRRAASASCSGLQVRRAAARRLRVRHRPAGGDLRERGEHPRGHRVPKTQSGADLMTGAPSPSRRVRSDLHLKTTTKGCEPRHCSMTPWRNA